MSWPTRTLRETLTTYRLKLLTYDLGWVRKHVYVYMGGCQNNGPFLGILNIRCRIKIGYPKRDHNFDNHPYT